jgi:hypothetical protein
MLDDRVGDHVALGVGWRSPTLADHDSTKRLRGEQFYTDASWPIPLDAATSVGAGGGCNDQNPARPSSVFLLGRVRHGDRARGSEPAHLRG